MASRIGSDLRRARTRREIDLAEVEAATRIRARFISAIENEEWDVLPGGFYTRGFIRTYASYLGLDGDRLAEDYRREAEGTSPSPPGDVPEGSPSRKLARPSLQRRPPRPGWLALPAVLAVGAVAVLAFPGGGGQEETTVQPEPQRKPATETSSHRRQPSATHPESVAIGLLADAEVWVCVLNANGSPLVNGQILQAGEEAGSFRSDSFTVSFGNGEVTMTVDGKRTEIPPTASPVGYAIDSSGQLNELSEAERPTCE